jgi:hypothetical protein
MDFFADKKQVSNADGAVATDDWSKNGRRFKQLWSRENMQVDRFSCGISVVQATDMGIIEIFLKPCIM